MDNTEIVDRYGNEIVEGCTVRFSRPTWNHKGEVAYVEVVETVKRLRSGALYAYNYEEDCFYIPCCEMEVIRYELFKP